MARKLWINNKLASINGKTQGYIIFQGVSYEWNNNETQIALTLITNDDKWFITSLDTYFVIINQPTARVRQGVLEIENNGKVAKQVVNLAQGTVSGETLTL